LWRTTLPIPRRIWQRQESQNVLRNERSLGIMSEAHHRVRNLAVKELVRVGKPLAPGYIAQELNLPVAQMT